MIPVPTLHSSHVSTSRDLERLGLSTWERFDAWTKNPAMARDALRGGGLGENGQTTDQAEDARLDRQAAGYLDELDRLTKRMYADNNRLRTLLRIANPDAPRSGRPGDLSTVELAADGWCPSCYRDDRYLSLIAKGRYSDRCRPCGEFRAAARRDPTVDELRVMHKRSKVRRTA